MDFSKKCCILHLNKKNMQNTEKIIQDYKEKMYIKDIQIKYNISYFSLIKLLKNNNVYEKNYSLKYSNEIISFIKDNYLIMQNKEIANKLNISEDHLGCVVKSLNLPKKGSGWKYTPEIDNIDLTTKEFSYLLGWLASDGNISKDYRNISLRITDKEIIDIFLKIYSFGHYYKNNYNNKKDLHTFHICSTFLAKKLADIGITPNKTYSLSINKDFWNIDFLRGFFEGDGHIRNTFNKKYKRYSVGFVSASLIFIKELKEFLELHNIKSKISKENNYYRLNLYKKENLLLFYNLIYKNEEFLTLKRKKQIFEDLLFSNK